MTVGVEHLIKEVKASTRGGDAWEYSIMALGEAGGIDAVDFLITEAKASTRGGTAWKAAIKALGRASRTV